MSKKLPIYRAVSDKIDKLNAGWDQKKLACQKGCAFCCHQRVIVTKEELEELVAFLNSHFDKDQLEKIRRKSFANGMTFKKNPEKALPCSLLDENDSCSVYEHRPFECRKYYSYSVDVCKKFMNDRKAFDNEPESYDLKIDQKYMEIMSSDVWPLMNKGGAFDLSYSIFLALTYPNDWKNKLEPFPRV